jgi:diacylglycerol kinase (ATP)
MLREVCRNLRENGAEPIVAAADSLEADRRLAREAAENEAFDAVIAAGGDSTVRGVASGLVGSDMPLGIIPVGTGNVLAHEIGMRQGPRGVARCLMEGPSTPIRIGRANGEPFSIMASVGFDARALARLDIVWKQRVGKFAYVWPVIRELTSDKTMFEVQIDGRTHRCTWLIVTKVRHYAGPFVITRKQHLYSHQFQAAIITAKKAIDLAGVMLAIGVGRAEKHPDVEIVPCGEVVVPGGQGVATQLDGEAFSPPPLEIRTGSESFRLIVPPDWMRRAPRTPHVHDGTRLAV